MAFESEDTCVVCLRSLADFGCQRLSCGHVLHESCVCLMRKYEISGRCPLCRADLEELSPVKTILEKAGLAHAQGRHADEFALLSEILSIDPEHPSTNANLGNLFHHGKGVTQNVEKAFEFYEQAHRAGNATATCNLGLMYKQGQGVTQNLAKAVQLYEQAHRAGNATATCNLGLMYKQGQGVTQNLAKAVELYEQAHRAGDARATRLLSAIGEKARFVTQHLARDVELLGQASSGANTDAASRVEKQKVHAKNIHDLTVFPKACSSCGDTSARMLCTCCYRVLYCSVHCQRRDRRAHRELVKIALASPLTMQSGEAPTSALTIATVPVAPLHEPLVADSAPMDPQDFDAGIAASLAESDAQAVVENAQISEAVLRSRFLPAAVYLLEFRRDPASFHRALMESKELEACKSALLASGFNFELPCGAKVFVPADMFEATMMAIEFGSLKLQSRHVIVTEDLEEVVMHVLQPLANSEKVRRKSRHCVPIGFAEEASQMRESIIVSRTFINIRTQSSLRSAPTSGLATASTTDAHSSRNPRMV